MPKPMVKRSEHFSLAKERITIRPHGRIEQGIGTHVPRGARCYLLERPGIGTTPIYLYTKPYKELGGKRFMVLDFRNTPLSTEQIEHAEIMHKIAVSLGLGKTSEHGRLIIKTYGGWKVEKTFFEEMMRKAKEKKEKKEKGRQ